MPEETKKTPEAAEKPTNCMKCNKRLSRKTWYYKNNGYYCSKGCWQQAVKAQAAKKEKKA
ncbi:MAG: hypothetical protein Q7O04_04120 [Candidatus Omnitrophota bacterium]|nr:hypothetical protein [Candidatus Omnitrophota bacterium]